MKEFAIFQINLQKAQRADAFCESDFPLEQAQECLGKLFQDEKVSVPLHYRENDKAPIVEYQNYQLANKENMIIWRVHNQLPKNIIEKGEVTLGGVPVYEKNLETSHPYGLVIIDNRPDKCYLAIERCSAWRRNSNKLNKILTDCLSDLLRMKFGLELSMVEQTIPTKIWDFCETRCKDGRDFITQINIEMRNPVNYAPYRKTQNLNYPSFIKEHIKMMELNDAIKTHVSFDYADATTQKIKESLEDIANIVYNCTQSEFTLGVKFKSGEFYKCGEEVAAIYPLNDDVINDFIGSGKELFDGNSLTTWFDMIYANLKSIQDEATA